jgi:hypothetical protein
MVVGHLLLTAALFKDKNDRGFQPEPDREQQRKDREARLQEVQTLTAARQRVAHRAEEGYKQRYLPDQGWTDVTPSRTFQVALGREESSSQGTNTRNDELVVLKASMRRDDTTEEKFFTVPVWPGQNAADLEKDIWRMHRIQDADVAIELLGSDGEPIPADAAVLDALQVPARIVVVRFVQRSSADEVILSASTLGESFEVSIAGTASLESLSAKICNVMRFDATTSLRLVRADGLPLHMDMLVNTIP